MRSSLLFLSLLLTACSFEAGDPNAAHRLPDAFRLGAPGTLGEMTVRMQTEGEDVDSRVRIIVKDAVLRLHASPAGGVAVNDLVIELDDDNADIPSLSPLGARLKSIHSKMTRCQVSSTSWSDHDETLEFRGAAPLSLGLALSGHESFLPQPPRSLAVVVTNEVVSLSADGAWLELPDVEFRDLVIIGRALDR